VRDEGAEPRRRGMGELRRAASFVPARRRAVAAWREFREAVLPGFVAEEDGIYIRGDSLYLVPEPLRETDLDAVSRPGLPLGRLRPGRFEPAHALATAVQPEQAKERAQWTAAYLRGETVPDPGPDGWVLVVYERWGLGWARRSRGVLKNFFPKGQRRTS
jgi:NOL1/NOP2/fmu family ribosome biogenesis protein